MKYFIKRAVLFPALFVFLLAAVLAVKAQAPCAFPVFSNGTEFQSGQNPVSLAAGDVNNDGKLDVVSANFESGGPNNTLSVFLGDGAGGFSSNTQYTAGRYPTAVTLKDLNADGKLDAVVLNETDQKVTIMLGNGAGAFSILTQYPVLNPSAVEPMDVNHDAKIDLIVSAGDSSNARMYFYPGIGDGTFAAPVVTTIPGSFNSPKSPTFGDFNDDGETDFVYKMNSGVSFWSGDGAGNFTMGWTSNEGQGGVVAGNLNNDAHLDFIAIDPTFYTVKVFLGNGDGTFQIGQRYDIPSVPQTPRIADLNADGSNDIVITHWTSNEVSILLGTGGGVFKQPKNQTVANKPRGLVVGDYNGDGKPDVVTTSFRYNTVMLTLGNGDGTFRAPTNIKNVPDTYSNASIAADLNADGREDLVTANSNYFGLYVYLRNGNFKFQTPRKILPSIYFNSVNTGDFNRDGKLDLVAVGGSQGRILLGDGFGNFSAQTPLTVTQNSFAVFVDSADFNGDGKADLVVSTRFGGILIYFGNGDGTFDAPTAYQSPGLGQLYEIAIGDFNGDTKKDLAIVSDNDLSANGKVQIRLNAGNGTFPTATDYIVGQSIHPRGILTADFNRDGRLDVAVSTITDSAVPYDVYIFNGNGNGTFSSALQYSTGAVSPWDLVAKDFNNDGKLDIATSNYSSEDVTVFAGNGDSTFTRVQRISAGGGPVAITSGSFNNDTSADLLVTTQGELTVIPNDCNRAADSAPNYDFDGDGKTDIGIFRPSSSEWWLIHSSSAQTSAAQFGNSSDKPVPADFTGDGRTDIAVFRPASGEWFILRSEDGSFFSFPFGTSGDIPLVGDFDADGKADPGIFRPSTSEWFIQKSSGGTIITTFGTAGDFPVPADYDGDRKTDIAIYRPSNGQWWLNRSAMGVVVAEFGNSTDKPVQGDYTGDGKADIAFFRPSTGFWFIQRSEDNSFFSFPFGTAGDIPVAGDYDGDGKFDSAIFRPSNSTWFLNRTTAGVGIVTFGTGGDRPIPNVFVP